MLTLIFITLVVIFLGYYFNREITTQEYLILTGINLLVILIVYGITSLPYPNDIYYESGKVIRVEHHPYFKERYQQMHTQVYSCGKSTCTRIYFTTEYDSHREYWLAKDTLGQEWEIDRDQYMQMRRKLGTEEVGTSRGRYHHGGTKVAGDDRLFFANNTTGTYEYPTTMLSHWHNPIKGTSSIFNTEKTASIDYPKQFSILNNERLLVGTKIGITQKDLDIFNTKIYETIGANVIILQVDDIQQLKKDWNSGKKNDIIIGYKGDYKKPSQVVVFGWYEHNILASKLETFILDNGITKESLNGIQHIIVSYYSPFDFKQFRYIRPPHLWQIILSAIFTIITVTFVYVQFASNEDTRDGYKWDRW